MCWFGLVSHPWCVCVFVFVVVASDKVLNFWTQMYGTIE